MSGRSVVRIYSFDTLSIGEMGTNTSSVSDVNMDFGRPIDILARMYAPSSPAFPTVLFKVSGCISLLFVCMWLLASSLSVWYLSKFSFFDVFMSLRLIDNDYG